MGEIKGMGRRDFLKTAALSGLALGGAAALTGCAPSTGAEKGASANASAGADVAWDKEEVVKYFTNATDGRVDQAVLNSFIDNGSTFIDWISEEMGWKFAASPLFGDYYEPMDGWIPMGRGSLGAADASGSLSAAQMWDQMSLRPVQPGVRLL